MLTLCFVALITNHSAKKPSKFQVPSSLCLINQSDIDSILNISPRILVDYVPCTITEYVVTFRHHNTKIYKYYGCSCGYLHTLYKSKVPTHVESPMVLATLMHDMIWIPKT